MRANVSMGLMVTTLILQSKILDMATLNQIKHAAAVVAATLVEWAHVAVLKVETIMEAIASGGLALPAMIAAGAAATALVAGVGTGAFAPQANINVKTDVNVETNVDEALKKQNQQVKDELKRLTP